jgi:uncharacterized protein DUF3300
MKRTLAILLMISISFMTPYTGIQVQALAAAATAAAAQLDDWDVQFSDEQLENLVAPVALYPDPLLAQVLLAATFPDQIDEAARQVRAYGSGYAIDSAYWDVSVKAVAHYPTVLSMMADKLDWTTSLGQAYVNQSSEVMEAVQRLRRQARSAGYLVNTPQWEIEETGGYVYIYPAQPEYIYVPVYDPAVVFIMRAGFHGPAIWFGTAFLIGVWLNHDCDWGHHRVFYHGWEGGPRWIGRSRPHIRINNIYVSNHYRNVMVNRTVINRHVNYGGLNRYNSIHRDVDYGNVRRQRGAPNVRPEQPRQPDTHRDNKIIRRNIDPGDPRINENRGRGQWPQSRPDVSQPRTQHDRGNIQVPRQPEARQPQAPPIPQQRGNVQVPRQPEIRQPQTPPFPQQRGNIQVPRQPEARQPQSPPLPQQRGNIQVPRQPEARQPQSVFRGGGGGSIDSRSASQRGQSSRESRPAPAARPAQQQRAPQAPRAPQGQPHGRGR